MSAEPADPCRFEGLEPCPRPAKRGGYCWTHIKQEQRMGEKTDPTPRHASEADRHYKAAETYANAETEEQFRRAKDNLDKAAEAHVYSRHGKRISKALVKKAAEGIRLGRPPGTTKMDPARVLKVVEQTGSAKRASAVLGIAVRTVRRYAKRARHDRAPR